MWRNCVLSDRPIFCGASWILYYLLEYCMQLIVSGLTLLLPDLMDQSYQTLVTYVTI